MEGKDKKKESIDEILSDLNGLLNKMPSILDGIKMPELQPLEPPRAAAPQPEAVVPEPAIPEPVTPEPAPRAEENFPPQDYGDKTVVLQPFSGLPEGAPAPELRDVQPAPEPESSPDADKTVVLQPFAGLSLGEQSPQEPAPAPEPEPQTAAPENLAPQSLGDFMFGQEAQDAEKQAEPGQPFSAPAKLSGSVLEPPEEKPARPVPAGPSLSISEFTPPAEEAPAAAQPAAQEPAAFQTGAAPESSPQALPEPAAEEPAFAAQSAADIFPAAEAAPEKPDALPAYANTSDFGIPDIDALIQMSEDGKAAPEQAAAPLPEAGVIPESVQAIEESTDGPSIQGLSEEPQPAAQGDTVEPNEPEKEENTEAQQPEPAASAFDAFAIDPSADAPAQADGGIPQPEPQAAMPEDQGGETLRLDPPSDTPVLQAAEELSAPEPAAAPAPQAEGGIEFGSFAGLGEAAPAAEAAPEAFASPEPAAGGQELSPGGAGLELSVGQPQAEAADQTIPGGAGLELSVGRPQTDMPGGGGLELGGGDATLVMPPDSSGDEEKTVIFQAGAPSTTSRAQAGDLTDLASKQAPEGIPAERLRTLMFLYASEDKALCATVLAELDSICLKSAVKPMFIKRSAVNECDPEANPNFVQQSVTESGAQGLICLGNIPPDKVSEIEGAFAASGGFFRYYDSSSFSHSAALDLVTDLIVR